MTGDCRTIVMQSFTGDRSKANPYVTLLVENFPDVVSTEFFSWRLALLGRFDVFHVHWPEAVFASQTRVRRVVKQGLFILLIARCRLQGRPIVRTVHNVIPHDSQIGAIERFLYGLLDRATKASICMNDINRAVGKSLRFQIPHGHYRDVLSRQFQRDPLEGNVLYFGQIRRYKGVVELVTAFSGLAAPDIFLEVMGSISDPSLQKKIADAAETDSRISVVFGHVSDADLEKALSRAQLAVLPYAKMNNSGALLFALSAGVPVLAPRCNVTEELVAEVGPMWVKIYDGSFSGVLIDDTLKSLPSMSAFPEFAPERDWPSISSRTADVYAAALQRLGVE